MSHILNLPIRYVRQDNSELDEIYSSSTGINRQGDQLEYFVKDLIADSVNISNKEDKNDKHKSVFSWLGSRNNPPDMMIRSGVSIEVKKCRSSSSVQLNSSTPHQKLKNTDSRITEGARHCESWTKKDMVYVVGNTTGSRVDKLWVVYGDCWSDKSDTYTKLSNLISNKIQEGVDELENGHLDVKDTNEIGKIYEVDPQGRTKLRIRGMWTIDHPEKCFSNYVSNYEKKVSDQSPLFFVSSEEKYNEFPRDYKRKITESPNITKKEVQIPNPEDTNSVVNTIILECYTTDYE
jgi:hypothetical protein